jgi:Cu-Zn family superoxide dismutase
VDATDPATQTARMTKHVLLSALLVSVLSGSAMADDKAKMAPAKPVTVTLKDAAGKTVGTAKLSPDPAGVKIALSVKGLAPGEHAIHVHETGKCDAPDFKSAGGHFNPEHKKHGLESPDGPHAGDMPNFTVDAKGASTATLVAPGIKLDGSEHSVFTGGGTALVIHAKADDLKTDPAGAAGERVACGLIKK